MTDLLQLLKPLENELLSQVSGQSVHWCRRGTTAGAWAFKAASLNRPDIKEPEVVLPSTACSTMPAAVLLAGCQIRFADVSLHDALPTVASIKAVLTDNTVAVLFIHMFGNTADLDELHALLKARDIWLIEDAAQSFGGHTPSGKVLGATGEMTLHGFTDNKILESGGGALLVRDPVCQPFIEEARRLLPHPELLSRDLYSRYDRSFQSIYNGMVEYQRIMNAKSSKTSTVGPPWLTAYPKTLPNAFASIILSYSNWFMQCEPPTMRLTYERRHLEASIDHRLTMAALYRYLIPEEIGNHISHFDTSGNCWRYTILLNETIAQEDFIASLRRKGYQATDLYWPLDTLLGDAPSCPNALELGKRIVNLPVDKTVNEEMVRDIVKLMLA